MKFVFKLLLLMAFLSLERCGEESFFAKRDAVEIFPSSIRVEEKNLSQEATPKQLPLNIVWLVDCSGSMNDEQRLLGTSFSSFIDLFLDKKLKFKMEVMGAGGRFNNTSEYLNNIYAAENEVDFKEKFMNLVYSPNRKICGFSSHNGLVLSTQFLGANNSWMDKNALLVVIYISDDDDLYSPSSVEDYVQQLKELKSSPSLLKIFSIVNHTHGSTRISRRYMEAARMTGDEDHIADIHSNFDTLLNTLSEKIVRLSRSFSFKKENMQLDEIDKIIVLINGEKIPEDGYEHHNNSDGTIGLTFQEDYVPPPNAQIKVSFIGLNRSFPLNDLPNQEEINKMEVLVNEEPIDKNNWKYIKESNSVEFINGYTPPPDRSIKVIFANL